jgi:hypothetical protein
VTVVEAGRDGRALQIDQSRVFAPQSQHFFIAADFDDTIAPRGDGLGLWLRFVDGPDEAVMQDQVGGFRAGLAGGGRSVGRSLKSETERRRRDDSGADGLGGPNSIHERVLLRKINREEAKNTKFYSDPSSCSSLLRG